MTTSALRRPAALAAAGIAVLALSACSSKPADYTVAVTGTDTECTPAQTSGKAGVIEFSFSNKGSKDNELYLLDAKGDTVGERENVGPGTTATLTVEVKDAGTYQLQCKPGQSGKGIKTAFTVTQ